MLPSTPVPTEPATRSARLPNLFNRGVVYGCFCTSGFRSLRVSSGLTCLFVINSISKMALDLHDSSTPSTIENNPYIFESDPGRRFSRRRGRTDSEKLPP